MKTLYYPDGPRADCIRFATSFKDRLIGLMFRTTINANEGLFFPNVNAIHTIGMRVPIDVLFLSGDPDGELQVIDSKRSVKPGTSARSISAEHTLELAAGALDTFGPLPTTVRFA